MSYNLSLSSDYEPLIEPMCQFLSNINRDENATCCIYGYNKSRTKSFLYYFLNLIFLGIPFLLCTWYPSLKLLFYRKTPLRYCHLVYVTDNHSACILSVVTEKVHLPVKGNILLRYFVYRHNKIIWIDEEELFNSVEQILPKFSFDSYLSEVKPLSEEESDDWRRIYGDNEIKIEIKSYWKLFKEEVFNPFYVFQVFSMCLWCFDNYVIYASCILALTVLSIITSLIETRKQSVAMHDLVESSKCQEVIVMRPFGSEIKPMSENPAKLVPGDVIVIPSASYVLPCDVILLNGQCIVNESMLTGESVPVTKTAPHPSAEIYSPENHKRHTLFSGTMVIQTRYYGGEYVLAKVVRTGFATTKGALVKSILYPTPITIKFYKDSFKFIFVLFIIATIGTTYCIYLYWRRHASFKEILVRSLDIITIVVPPALPAAMTVGMVYSQNRLKRLGIFSISPQRINVCGKIKLACFDKTGTLTQEGLDMHSVIPCKHAKFQEAAIDIWSLSSTSRLVQAMACCHSLTRINGELNGDPLDLNMFNFTQWELEEPGNVENARFDMLAPTIVRPKFMDTWDAGSGDTSDTLYPYELGIIRQFPFSSTLQCMSVVTRMLSSPNMIVFTKGAPEKLLGMCDPVTIPSDFAERLALFTSKGYRVIALGFKEMPDTFKWKNAQKVQRDAVECDLKFLGLLIMQNTLKPETTPVIRTLQKANIRIVMITGDNVLTAVSVARECQMVHQHEKVILLKAETSDDVGLIPKIVLENIGSAESQQLPLSVILNHYHFAIDGKTWSLLRTYYPDLLPSLLVRTTVFARFQPDQKTQLIKSFQNLDYIVSMVGDGANDCGALKAAHVGVSLSQAEASVAAPFTSSIQNISCLTYLILEGRCALVTSFAVFKYMAMYSIIQFLTVLILYRSHSILGDMQFLFIDLVITTSLAVTIGLQGPSRTLTSKRPLGSLVSLKNLIPLILQIILCGLIQIGSLYYLSLQPWFQPVNPHQHGEQILCWENTVLFTVSCYQYVVLAIVYAKGGPYRVSRLASPWFMLDVLTLLGFTTFLMIYPEKHVASFFEVVFLAKGEKRQEWNFRYTLLGFPSVHLIASALIEGCLYNKEWLNKCIRFVIRKKLPKNKYKVILNSDNNYEYWISSANI